jgi:hypothetical protein
VAVGPLHLKPHLRHDIDSLYRFQAALGTRLTLKWDAKATINCQANSLIPIQTTKSPFLAPYSRGHPRLAGAGGAEGKRPARWRHGGSGTVKSPRGSCYTQNG